MRALLVALLPSIALATQLWPVCRADRRRPPPPSLLAASDGIDAARDKLTSWWSSQQSGFNKAKKAAVDPDSIKAAELLKKRGLANANKAAALLRAALKRDPDNVDLKLQLADAINMEIRIRTNANSLVIEGTQDSPAFKRIWRTLGGESYALAIEARKAYPSSVKVLAVYADAFLYTTSSKGIVKQALTGAGKQYLSIAKELYSHPEWDAAVGCAFLGGFYQEAPWPVGNKKLARKYLREGAKIAPTRRNLYYAGVNAYRMGEYVDAVAFFQRSLKASPCRTPSSTEDDFAAFITSEARRALKASEAALQAHV